MIEKDNLIILEPGAGKELSVGNSKLFFKLLSDQTQNQFSITEYVLSAGFPGPPPHKHKVFEHAWYILEGELCVKLGIKEIIVKSGGFIFIPKKVVHSFSNTTDLSVRLLVIDTPGGFEQYYKDLQIASADGKAPGLEVYREIQLKYDTYPQDYLFE